MTVAQLPPQPLTNSRVDVSVLVAVDGEAGCGVDKCGVLEACALNPATAAAHIDHFDILGRGEGEDNVGRGPKIRDGLKKRLEPSDYADESPRSPTDAVAAI